MSGQVYILILNWNNWRDTIACLESVMHLSYPAWRVVVMDNGSTDGSYGQIRQWAEGRLRPDPDKKGIAAAYDESNKPVSFIEYTRTEAEEGGLAEPASERKLVLIQNGADLGVPGNNTGIIYALKRGADYVWMLNNDTLVHPDALTELVEELKRNPTAGMAGSKVLYHHAPDTIQTAGGCRIMAWAGNPVLVANGMKDDGGWDRPIKLDSINGASLLVRREAIEAAGLLDHDYFLYWEDADWCFRVRRKGFALAYAHKSRIWHKEGGTIGGPSAFTDYYWTRNGLLYTSKSRPVLLPLVLIMYLVKYAVLRPLRGMKTNFGSFLRGVRDFFAGVRGESL